MKCEQCGAETDPESGDLFDYCAGCSQNLCPRCMERWCCGTVPAQSGMEQDDDFGPDPTADERRALDGFYGALGEIK